MVRFWFMDQDVCQSLIAVKMAVAVVFEISYLAFGDMTRQ